MVPPVICMPELRLRSALSTPSVIRFFTTMPVVPPEVTSPSSPPTSDMLRADVTRAALDAHAGAAALHGEAVEQGAVAADREARDLRARRSSSR
jgi:hypothetical protein